MAGWKKKVPCWLNQDSHLILSLCPGRLLMGVFDGHGRQGHLVAERVRGLFAHFGATLLKEPGSQAGEALRRCFALAQEGLVAAGLAESSGATAVVATIDVATGTVDVAHLGNSRLLVCSGMAESDPTFTTGDHAVEGDAERRILDSGGEVHEATISGVTARRLFLPGQSEPGLSTARALGNLQARSVGLSDEPSIHLGVRLPPGGIIVLASAGVWDKVSDGEVAEAARRAAAANRREGTAKAVASAVVKKARSRWPEEGNGDVDDITSV
eukprot:CAMPEP_0170632084 /NCGR_PEP_ID=MMETSP0224-20130122/35065_1 /TAXON_ID=285029 /ORGANISM="Togula jolla, Strain CCCM 725" /LENGTH=269 /DNA_ID=CAMNT_0010960625 /DNA_START=9 /DNA_END=815 /DNA_ORIENTATION=-